MMASAAFTPASAPLPALPPVADDAPLPRGHDRLAGHPALRASGMRDAPDAPGAPESPGVLDAPGAPHIAIGGWVRRTLALDAAALEALGARTLAGCVIRCTVDGAHGPGRALRAVPLSTLIERATPAFDERTDFKRALIVARGADGYRALFSWGEVFNTRVGRGVQVAFDCAATPLDARTGPFALISLHDTFTGPRFVRGLASVALHKLW